MKNNTTLLRDFSLLLLLVLFSSISASAQDEVIWISFDSTTGNNTDPGGSSIPWPGNGPLPASGNLNVFEAGGAIRLGTETEKGYITTVPLDFEGVDNVSVIYNVKGWTTVEGAVKIIFFTPMGEFEHIETYTSTMSAPFFESYVIDFPEIAGMSNVQVRLETTEKRAFIDSFLVTTNLCSSFPGPSVQPQAFCGSTTVADLEPSGTIYNWYASETGTPLESDYILTTNTFYISSTNWGCESNLVPVSITVTEIPDAPEILPLSLCSGATVAELSVAGAGLLWYTSADGGLPLDTTEAIVEGDYYASQQVNNCEGQRALVPVSIVEVDMPDGEAAQQFTAGQTLEDLDITSTAPIIWYSNEALTAQIPSTTALVNGITYYAVAAEGTCLSEVLAVTVTEALINGSFTLNGLKFYPNPVSNTFIINYEGLISSVLVYNLLGQPVLSQQVNDVSAKVDVSGLSTGPYLVKIFSGNEIKTIKILKL